MEVRLNNIGIISESTIEIDGLTVVTGHNNSGKTTVGKVLYAIISAVEDLHVHALVDKTEYALPDRAIDREAPTSNVVKWWEYVTTGFATEKSDANTRTHKENLKLKIRLKAYESLALFEKILLPEIGDGSLNEKLQKQYIAVIDSEVRPMQAYADVLKEKSGRKDTFRYEIFKNSLLIYGKEMKNGKKLFYDRVDVWYDFEFDRKAEKLA